MIQDLKRAFQSKDWALVEKVYFELTGDKFEAEASVPKKTTTIGSVAPRVNLFEDKAVPKSENTKYLKKEKTPARPAVVNVEATCDNCHKTSIIPKDEVVSIGGDKNRFVCSKCIGAKRR